MNNFTEEQITLLAPDPSSLKSGKDLAQEKKWMNCQYNERVLWGEVQGSGKDPYRTQIDLLNIAFKCSCPSRKFPCKHGIGLFLLFIRNPASFSEQLVEPNWVKEWIDKRQTSTPAPVDSKALDNKKAEKQAKEKEKRSAERMAKVSGGVAELERWTRDLVRGGLLSVAEKDSSFWSKTVARMVDAQAAGLGNMVREFSGFDFFDGHHWHSEVLVHTSKIYLLLEAFKRINSLPPQLQEDVKTLIGWTQSQKDLLESSEQESISDHWLVLGRQTEVQEDLTIQRNWLFGAQSRRYALILNFAFRNGPIPTLFIPGTMTEAELVFFPGTYPLRAAIRNLGKCSGQLTPPASVSDWEEAQDIFATIISQNPWADMIPFFVEQLTPVFHASRWLLKDRQGKYMEVSRKYDEKKIFKILALSGGAPLSLFILRLKNKIFPVGIWQEGAYYIL